ncbi:MAG: hypothetical protein AAF433_14755 [Bacteroidota bacterium]
MILRTTRLLFLLMASCWASFLLAQERPHPPMDGPPPPAMDTVGPSLERVKYVRQAFLTREMELTEEEAAAFFPLFWELERERRQLARQTRRDRPTRTHSGPLTEAEARERLQHRRGMMDQRRQLEESYQDRFLEVIPALKLLELETAEREFRRLLLNRVRERRHGGANRPRRGDNPPRRPRGE